MKRIVFLLTGLVLLNLVSFAQKDAPVAGHAAQLVDYLKKDYNSVTPESRDEEIGRDRTTVISIFKTYLADDQKKNLNSTEFIDKEKKARGIYIMLDDLKQKLELYSGLPTKTPGDLATIKTTSDSLKSFKGKYYQAKFEADEEELELIAGQYKTGNVFLDTMVGEFKTKYKKLSNNELDRFSSSNSSSSIQKGIPFIGGALNFETAIKGLSQFIASRIKEELTTYVINKVKEWLENPSEDDPIAELKVMLPRTTSYLRNFEASQVTNFVNEIRQYIEDDLNKILPNAAQLRNTPRIRRFLENHPDIDFAFEALELIPNLAKVKTPVDYFTFLENSRNIIRWRQDTLNRVKCNIANAIDLTGLLSRSMLIIDNGESRFAGIDFITTYAAETGFFKLYTGFLRQQNIKYYNVKFNNAGNLALEEVFKKIINISGNLENNKMFFKTLLTDAARNAEKVFNTGMEIRKANKSNLKVGADTVYNFVEGIISFSEDISRGADSLVTMLDTHTLIAIPPLSQLKPYFSIARTTNEIVFDLRKKKYATALIKAVDIGAQLMKSDRFSSVSSLLSKIALIQQNEDIKSWPDVIKFISDQATVVNIPVSPEIKTATFKVGSQLKKIEIFYQLNYMADPGLLAQMQQLRKLCLEELQDSSQISVGKLAGTKQLFINKDYQRLLVSYYSAIALDAATKKISVEMKELKIKSEDREIRVFSDAEAERLASLLNDYILELYNNYLKDGQSVASARLQDLNRRLVNEVAEYITLLPEKSGKPINTNLLLLIHFVNDMAMSESADDVERAIRAFALPSGSYSVKRKAISNFSINTYPGIMPACEISSRPGRNTAFSIGFTVPVGLSFSKGYANGSSLGIFVPVIDIGAITRVHLDSSRATQALPEFSFKNIVSPGLFISYGFKKSPISINLGIQYGPDLREIQTDGTTKSYESFRIGAGLTLDIPLFNLHNRPR